MNRREFTTGLVALMISSTLNANIKVKKRFDIFIDESGDIGTDQSFVIGALIVDSDYNYKKMEDIRTKANYQPTLTYNSSNKYKLNFVKPLVKEFFENTQLSYSALAFSSKVNNTWPSEKRHRTVLYQQNYNNLLKNKRLSGVELNIYLEQRTLTGEDQFLKSSLEKNFDNLRVTFIKDIESNSMQLCDLITGSLYGKMNGTADKTKSEILDIFNSYVNPHDLAKSFDFTKGKFTVDFREHI